METHPSVYFLRVISGLSIFFALCSLSAAVGALYAYGGIFQWWRIILAGLPQGVLYIDGDGFFYAFVLFALLGIGNLLTFVFTFIAYRRGKVAKKPLQWSMVLFGMIILVLIGSHMVFSSPLCIEDGEDGGKLGSDDTITCTIQLPFVTSHPSPTH